MWPYCDFVFEIKWWHLEKQQTFCFHWHQCDINHSGYLANIRNLKCLEPMDMSRCWVLCPLCTLCKPSLPSAAACLCLQSVNSSSVAVKNVSILCLEKLFGCHSVQTYPSDPSGFAPFVWIWAEYPKYPCTPEGILLLLSINWYFTLWIPKPTTSFEKHKTFFPNNKSYKL